MLRQHLEWLRPICPTCRQAPLQLGTIASALEADIREGVLVCTNQQCQREHPIVDGIPVVVADLRSWASHQLDAVLHREDLSPFIESLLGDAAGPASAFERERSTISSYARAHWGDLDCAEPLPRESSLACLLENALGMLRSPVGGTWIDFGCAAGRATRDLALRGADLVVGVDLSFGLLRTAEHVRNTGNAVYPMRRVGLVYDRREFAVADVPSKRMSFWCCDVANLPFADAQFAGALSLNVLDCVAYPLAHLSEMGRVLAAGGSALLSTPYDWSAAATAVEHWMGGHSQRGSAHGSSATELRRVLATVDLALRIEAEQDGIPWRVYLNERASMDYALHLLHLVRGNP